MNNASDGKTIPATLIPGDGIGPEIVAAVVRVLDVLGAPFAWETRQTGMAGVAAVGDSLPTGTLDSIRRTGLALNGPLTTPVGGGFRSVNVRLREAFQLFANVRPARTIVPGGRYENIDIVLVRENLEGLYVGSEHYIPIDGDPHAVAVGSGVSSRAGCRRIARFAFDYAVRNGRKKVTIIHKANICDGRRQSDLGNRVRRKSLSSPLKLSLRRNYSSQAATLLTDESRMRCHGRPRNGTPHIRDVRSHVRR